MIIDCFFPVIMKDNFTVEVRSLSKVGKQQFTHFSPIHKTVHLLVTRGKPNFRDKDLRIATQGNYLIVFDCYEAVDWKRPGESVLSKTVARRNVGKTLNFRPFGNANGNRTQVQTICMLMIRDLFKLNMRDTRSLSRNVQDSFFTARDSAIKLKKCTYKPLRSLGRCGRNGPKMLRIFRQLRDVLANLMYLKLSQCNE